MSIAISFRTADAALVDAICLSAALEACPESLLMSSRGEFLMRTGPELCGSATAVPGSCRASRWRSLFPEIGPALLGCATDFRNWLRLSLLPAHWQKARWNERAHGSVLHTLCRRGPHLPCDLRARHQPAVSPEVKRMGGILRLISMSPTFKCFGLRSGSFYLPYKSTSTSSLGSPAPLDSARRWTVDAVHVTDIVPRRSDHCLVCQNLL
jgi:hypothetical protein